MLKTVIIRLLVNIEAEKVKNNIETKAHNDASNLLSANELLLIYQGLLIGLVTGLIVSLFRLIIDQTLQMLAFLYPLMAQHWLLLIPYVAATLVIASHWGKSSRATQVTYWDPVLPKLQQS